MLLQKKNILNENKELEYVDVLYDSSNILQTTYFPEQERLYISFNRGGVYSYGNIDKKLYEDFENAESQGKFFAKTIKKNPDKYPYRKEYTLYPFEIEKLNEEKENNKKPNTDIIFKIRDVEKIRISEDGFYVEGKLIKNEEKIYDAFVNFLKDLGYLE